MAAGILMLLIGVAVLSRLFRHDLAGKVATLNLVGGTVGSASAGGGGGGDFDIDTRPIQGPAAPGAPAAGRTGGVAAPLAVRGRLNGTPGAGTHNGAPPFDNWQSSNAIDIAVPIGTATYAPVAGSVVRVSGSWAGGGGRTDGYGVTIRGADGNEFYLKHLSRVSVRAGDRVTAGQLIGASGAGNGNAHLHLAQLRGNPLDTFGYR